MTRKKKRKFTGLGRGGFGRVLKKSKGESIKRLAKRQTREFMI